MIVQDGFKIQLSLEMNYIIVKIFIKNKLRPKQGPCQFANLDYPIILKKNYNRLIIRCVRIILILFKLNQGLSAYFSITTNFKKNKDSILHLLYFSFFLVVKQRIICIIFFVCFMKSCGKKNRFNELLSSGQLHNIYIINMYNSA